MAASWWQRVLGRWDRQNQDAFDGVISEQHRAAGQWERTVTPDGTTRLVRRARFGGVIELDDVGIVTNAVRKRAYTWDRVAHLTWEAGNWPTLAVCLYGDPYVHDLGNGEWNAQVCRALLDDCRDFVEAHGASVYNTTDTTPSMWWSSRPEAQRGYHR
jgi:hypothetical protein